LRITRTTKVKKRMATLTKELVYQLISSLEELQNIKYTIFYQDPETQISYGITILRNFGDQPIPFEYVIGVSQINQSVDSEVIFYGIQTNPCTTEIIITRLIDTPILSYSISKTLVFVFYNNEGYQLSFSVPYVDDVKAMKQSILNLFAVPTRIYLLFDSLMIQYNFVEDLNYRQTLLGTFDQDNGFTLLTAFDFNRTLIGLIGSKAYFYWNSEIYNSVNPYPYLSFSFSSKDSIVIGFSNNFLIRTLPGVIPDQVANVSSFSLNVNEFSGNPLIFVSLTEILPIRVCGEVQYYFIGFGGSMNRLYATMQTVYLLNTSNVYSTSSFKIIFTTSLPAEPTYCIDDTLCFYLDLAQHQLYIQNETAFRAYLLTHAGTIMTSDLQFMTSNKTVSTTDTASLSTSCVDASLRLYEEKHLPFGSISGLQGSEHDKFGRRSKRQLGHSSRHQSRMGSSTTSEAETLSGLSKSYHRRNPNVKPMGYNPVENK